MKAVKIVVLSAILTIFGMGNVQAQSLGDLLSGGLGNGLGSMLEGVFSSSNISIDDMQGEWNSTGPAVCFQGDNFLKKAGGAAAATAVESKLQPYYDKYGLTGAILNINADGTFTLTTKGITLNGTITQNASGTAGVFDFNFTILNMNLLAVTTYVQKTSSSMEVMFDVTKLKQLLSAVAQFANINLLKTLSGILDSYDGLCVGFHFQGVGGQKQESGLGALGSILGGLTGGNSNSNTNNTNSNTNNTNNSNVQNQGTSGLGSILGGLLGGGANNTNTNTNSNKNTNNSNTNNSNNNNSNNSNVQNQDTSGLGSILGGFFGGGNNTNTNTNSNTNTNKNTNTNTNNNNTNNSNTNSNNNTNGNTTTGLDLLRGILSRGK